MNRGRSKLVLGTVQFGCQYGINSAGRPGKQEVIDILNEARSCGISILDTSSAYGDAETILGDCGTEGFDIISKYPKGSPAVAETFEASCRRLGTDRLAGYMLHHFELWRSRPALWDGFLRLRDSGNCPHIGFSLYEPEELDMLLEAGVDFDLLQFPRNLLDRRFDQYLPKLHARGVIVHVRSTYLQGLFFKDRNSLPQRLLPLRESLLQIDEAAESMGMDVASLAISFNCSQPSVDGVLVGVDNAAQLRAGAESVRELHKEIEINVKDWELLNPAKWNI